MPTIAQNIQRVRMLLGRPLPGSPTDELIINQLIESLMHHSSELTSVSAHWNVAHGVLSTSSGVEDYQITLPNFGRPFLVYTKDDSDPYHVRIEIPFTLLQNADRQYKGPQQSFSSSKHSAAEIGFYRTDQVMYARFIPIPNQAGDYEIWYDQNYQYSGPTDAPGIEAFHHLVRAHAALSLLPHTEWHGVRLTHEMREWNAKTSMLSQTLTMNMGLYQKQFNEYRAQMTREGVSSKLPYGWESEQDLMGAGRMIPGIGW